MGASRSLTKTIGPVSSNQKSKFTIWTSREKLTMEMKRNMSVKSKEALQKKKRGLMKNEHRISTMTKKERKKENRPWGLCYNSISLYLKYQWLYEFKYFNLKKKCAIWNVNHVIYWSCLFLEKINKKPTSLHISASSHSWHQTSENWISLQQLQLDRVLNATL